MKYRRKPLEVEAVEVTQGMVDGTEELPFGCTLVRRKRRKPVARREAAPFVWCELYVGGMLVEYPDRDVVMKDSDWIEEGFDPC